MTAKAFILGDKRVPLHAGIHPKQYKIAPVSGGTIIFFEKGISGGALKQMGSQIENKQKLPSGCDDSFG